MLTNFTFEENKPSYSRNNNLGETILNENVQLLNDKLSVVLPILEEMNDINIPELKNNSKLPLIDYIKYLYNVLNRMQDELTNNIECISKLKINDSINKIIQLMINTYKSDKEFTYTYYKFNILSLTKFNINIKLIYDNIFANIQSVKEGEQFTFPSTVSNDDKAIFLKEANDYNYNNYCESYPLTSIIPEILKNAKSQLSNIDKYVINFNLVKSSFIKNIIEPFKSALDVSEHISNENISDTNYTNINNYLFDFFSLLSSSVYSYYITISQAIVKYYNMLTEYINMPYLIQNSSSEVTMISENSYVDEFLSTSMNTISVLNESIYNLLTIHPLSISTDTLQEAAIDKQKIIQQLTDLKNKIIELGNKFISIITATIQKNKQWISGMSKFNSSILKDSNIQIEIYPYWKGFSILKNCTTPAYNDNDDPTNKQGYIEKYYKALVSTNGSPAAIKNIFRGGDTKETYKGMQLVSVYSKMLNLVNAIPNMINQIKADNGKIAETTGNAINTANVITESVILDESIYQDDYLYSLLEDNGPATTDNIDNQNNNDQSKQNDTNNTQLAISKVQKLKSYSLLCYTINACRMDIIDETYNQCVQAIYKLTKNKKISKESLNNTNNSDKTADNNKKNK